MNKKITSYLAPLLKFAIATALIVYLLTSGRFDPNSLKALLTPLVVGTGLLTVGVIVFFSSERWRVLLNQQKLVVSRANALRMTLIGTFFNFFVPGGVGGDLVKAVLVVRNHPEDRAKAALTVIADRVFGLFTMTFLALFSFAFEPELVWRDRNFQMILVGLCLLLAAFIVLFWILVSRRAKGLHARIEGLLKRNSRLHKLWVLTQGYRLTTSQFIKISLLSMGAQLTQLILFIAVAYQLEGSVPPISAFLFSVPVGFMVTAVPIAPAGIGIGQAAFASLFSQVLARETDMGVVGITAFQAFMLCYGLIGALLFVSMKHSDSKLSIHNLEEEAEVIT